MSYILQTNHLSKTIGEKRLAGDVNLHVKKGEIYGFLGPNGAGKTTVMKLIMLRASAISFIVIFSIETSVAVCCRAFLLYPSIAQFLEKNNKCVYKC